MMGEDRKTLNSSWCDSEFGWVPLNTEFYSTWLVGCAKLIPTLVCMSNYLFTSLMCRGLWCQGGFRVMIF